MWLLLGLYIGSGLVVSLLAFAWFFKLMLLLLISGHGIYAIRKHALRITSRAIIQCWLNEAGQWHLRTRSGQEYEGKLLGDSLITPVVTILNFKCQQFYLPVTLTIFPDAIEREAFRRLRVYLKTVLA